MVVAIEGNGRWGVTNYEPLRVMFLGTWMFTAVESARMCLYSAGDR